MNSDGDSVVCNNVWSSLYGVLSFQGDPDSEVNAEESPGMVSGLEAIFAPQGVKETGFLA